MPITTLLSWLQQGTTYLLDPSHRIMAIGIAFFVLFTLGRFIVKGIKLIILILVIFAVFYFGLKYLASPI